MITYVNSKDAKLFELAADALGLESLDIDQYLNKLAELKAISPKYVRLPLYEEGHEDEEIFEIDANARTIKVPGSFGKNGVGVVSDELAETVWFKINRYFDIKDFGKAAGVVGDELKDGNLHILIQWEAPDGAKGASWAYAIDKDTDPEYIYFGWALTAEHLTAKAGNIKFAIRIMEYDQEGEIAYSFATQPASVAVKAGLDFDLTGEDVAIESVADKIASRLMGGQIAHCPVFAPATEEPAYAGGDLPPYITNLTGTPATATLTVSAAAPEGETYDAIAYKWFKKASDSDVYEQIPGEYTPVLTVNSSGKYYVVVLGMNEIVDGEEYVYEGAGTPAVYYTEEDLAAYHDEHDNADPDWQVGDVKTEAVPASTPYKKFKYHTSVATSQSTICEIPSPIPLEIVSDIDPLLILSGEAELALTITRQHIGDDVVGVVVVGLSKTASAALEQDLTNEALFSDVNIALDGEATDELITYSVSDDGAVVVDMSNEGVEEGYYKLAVMNTLNGDEKTTISSTICRVVRPASAPTVSIELVSSASGVTEGSVAREDTLAATCSAGEHLSDALTLQWYEVVGEFDPDEFADNPIEGATALTFKPTVPGSYYVIATNTVATTTSTAVSNVIVFNA